MATKTRESKESKTRGKREKEPFNLATAQVTDGALEAPRSIYDIIGMDRSPYRATSIEEYRRELDKMNLYDLQAHAQKLAVLPSLKREITVQRLEDAFVKHRSRFPRQSTVANREDRTPEQISIHEQAMRILRRGV